MNAYYTETEVLLMTRFVVEKFQTPNTDALLSTHLISRLKKQASHLKNMREHLDWYLSEEHRVENELRKLKAKISEAREIMVFV